MKTKCSPLASKLRTELKRTRRQRDEAKQFLREDQELYVTMEREIAEKEREAQSLSHRISELEAAQVRELNNERQATANLRDENTKLSELLADGMRLLAEMHAAIALLQASRREEQAAAAREMAELRAKLDQGAHQKRDAAQAALEKERDEARALLPARMDDLAEACLRLSNTVRRATG